MTDRPATARAAATVALLRDAAGGPETFLLRRRSSMTFGAGMTVFPGGAVDPVDRDPADRPGVDYATVLRRAAVREVAEETGAHLDPAALHGWTRWITPGSEPHRFDTWFFVAALPAGQSATADPIEAVEGTWLTPAAALAESGAGTRPLLPPTAVTLDELTAYADVTAVIAAAAERDLTPIVPVIAGGHAVLPDGRVVAMPVMGPR